MIITRRRPQTTLTLVIGSLLLFGCAPKEKKGTVNDNVVKECVLAEEQQNSLQGKWATVPVKISFKNSEWSESEITAVQAGGQTWNSFFSTSRGFEIFELGVTGAGNISAAAQSVPGCSAGSLTDGTVLYKRHSVWGKSPTAVAVTTTCYNASNTGGVATIFNAIMEFNYVNFFVESAKRYPDMQSIAVHELGHLIGLDHSCGPLGKPNQSKSNVACPDGVSEPENPLVTAIMYPQVYFDSAGNGEEKRALRENDQGRANCLYEQK